MKKLPYLLFGALALAGNAFGQTTATTDPVGFTTTTAVTNSDTRLSLPLHRSTVFHGTVTSISNNLVTVNGAPAWTNSQFTYVSGTQTNTYYVEFTSGVKKGMFYTVTDNAAASLTLNLNGDSIATVVAGDSFSVIPYWTYGTLFSDSSTYTGTSSIGGAAPVTKILIPDIITPGTDLAAAATYFYYTGTSFGGAGWRQLGQSVLSKRNDDVISPDVYVIVRQEGSPTSSITATGNVPTTQRAYIIGTLAKDTDQDNAVSIDIPVPLTLSQSNLFQSGAFKGTTNLGGQGGDQLLVFDDSVSGAGFDKASSLTYFYYTGTLFGGAGWRQLGSPTVIQDNVVVLQPGSGYVIRKVGVGNPSAVVWNVPTPY